MFRIFTVLSFIFLACFGCAQKPDGSWKPPLVYRVDVQQGNVVDQKMINKLKPGMDKKQVRFIMGTPLLQDPFHNDRWDYIYSFEPGGGERKQRHISLHFKEDKLAKISGDIEVSHTLNITEEETKGKTVVVPLEEHEEGFFSKLFGSSPEQKEQKEEAEITESIQDSSEQSAETTETEPAEDTALVDDEYKSESLPVDEEEEVQPETAIEDETDEVPEIKKAQTQKEKNVLRRLWDRITSSEEDSTDDVEETERDQRDAEIFEEAGGRL